MIKGQFNMEFRDKIITVKENEFLIVPKMIEHRPVAEQEVSVLLFEPATTLNTGNTPRSELTPDSLEQIYEAFTCLIKQN